MYKSLVTQLLLILSLQAVYGQGWLEGSPSWKYRYELDCLSMVNGFDKIIYQSDTIIDSRKMSAYKVEYYRNEMGDIYHHESQLVLYDTLDVVYRYENSGLKELYNFNYEIGDTIIYEINRSMYDTAYCDSLAIYVLETIGTIILNSNSLRVQNWRLLSNEYSDGSDLTIIEKVGAINYGFYLDMSSSWTCGIDHCHPYEFRCYYNSELGISYPPGQNCMNIVGVELEYRNNDLEVYPNPTEDGIVKLVGGSDIDKVRVYTIMGELVYEQRYIAESGIDLSVGERGIYIVVLEYEDRKWDYKVIVKNN